jgi:cytochrome c oxidase assembly protein subunit 11
MQSQARPQKSHLRVVLPLMGVLAAMSTAVYYAVPLYRIFCQVTGFGGTVQRAEVAAPGGTGKRVFTVRLDGSVDRTLPWSFRPVNREISLRAGEEKLAHYQARNKSGQPVTGTATFNVTPQKAGQYFVKVACFCFTKQRLEAGRSVDMPVSFYIDPEILKDPNLRDVRTITLSYTFYRAPNERRTPSTEAAVRTKETATKTTKSN